MCKKTNASTIISQQLRMFTLFKKASGMDMCGGDVLRDGHVPGKIEAQPQELFEYRLVFLVVFANAELIWS